jgi:HEAT repeat protein
VPKRPTTEDALAAIHAIRQAPDQHDLARELAPFLAHKSNHVVAAAAATAERLEIAALAPDLAAAFERLMRDPAKLDPGCKALIAIVLALVALEDPAAKVYFAGVRHVQKEGSYGPPIDVAAPLRGASARGLARMGHPDALLECVTLLADPEIPARTGAARAIADSGRPDGVLLLRLKALLGDQEVEVIGECFTALLHLDPVGSLDFVAKFLAADDPELSTLAALALGESHISAAFPILRDAWQRGGSQEQRRTLLSAIGMLRNDDALQFLLAILGDESPSVAATALPALALYARDETVSARIRQIIGDRAEPALDSAFRREFPSLA